MYLNKLTFIFHFDDDFFTSQQLFLVAFQSIKFEDDLDQIEVKVCDVDL